MILLIYTVNTSHAYFFMKKLTLLLILAISFTYSKPALAAIDVNDVFNRVNYERQLVGLPKLVINPLLNISATEKAKSILETQIFQHSINNKTFESWIDESGYNYELIGENLAINYYETSDLLKGWMFSPSHKENILNNEFIETGLGVAYGKLYGVETIIVVQHFGQPTDKIIQNAKLIPTNFQNKSINLPSISIGATLIATGTSMGYITNLINRKRKTSN